MVNSKPHSSVSRIDVSGVGAVSPFGVGVQIFTCSLRDGRPGARLLPHQSRSEHVGIGATCERLGHLVGADAAKLPGVVPLAFAAAKEALEHAGFLSVPFADSDATGARRIGLILGTGAGGIDFTLDQAKAVHEGRRPSLWTITNATHGNLAGELSIRLGLRGPSLCVSTGCASSSDAIARAVEMLRLSDLNARARGESAPGVLDAVVVVGADAHVRPETLASMDLLGVLSRCECESDEEAGRVSRPFDAERDGFVLGEGAWALVLERSGALARRERTPIASVLGIGATCDAYHRVRPAPDMAESARAITDAVHDAGLRPGDIEVVQYHGTGTKLNDICETRAIRLAFGDHADRLVGSSIKGAIGHPQGASGAASVVAMIGALGGLDGGGPFVPPTINLESPDPGCDLDYTPLAARPGAYKTFMVNCLAFGAKNSVIVFRMSER